MQRKRKGKEAKGNEIERKRGKCGEKEDEKKHRGNEVERNRGK